MKHFLSILPFSFLTIFCYGQEFKTAFQQSFQEGDTTKQLEILTQWEQDAPKDAELFTSYFNYYFSRSKYEVLSITTGQPEGQSLSFQNSTGKDAGYIGSQISFHPEILTKAFTKIDQGISLYPNRLDMRFGKIYVLGQINDWQLFTDEIVKAIQYSDENKNQWTWTNNEKKENGKEFFLSSLQDYQLDLYNTGDDELLINMRTVAQEVLKYYPNHIESLSNLSITYLLEGEYDKAIEPLLKAEQINPTDPIVLSNLAQGYKLKGDKQMAIKYYEKTLKYADERTAAYAKQQIKELKK